MAKCSDSSVTSGDPAIATISMLTVNLVLCQSLKRGVAELVRVRGFLKSHDFSYSKTYG